MHNYSELPVTSQQFDKNTQFVYLILNNKFFNSSLFACIKVMENQTLVTVIITTRNEEHNIVACLESIRAQSVGRDSLEIVLIDNREPLKQYRGHLFPPFGS